MKSISTLIREKIKNLLFLLDYLLWLLADPCKFKRIDNKKIKKVIIIHLGAIGELLVTTPLFPALKKALNCEITLMVKKGKEKVLENNPYLSQILIDEGFEKNVQKLKKGKFDLAFIIYPVSIKISLMCLFSKIKYCIGGVSSGINGLPAFLFTKRSFPIIKKHAVEETLDIIRQIGIDNKNPRIEFYLSKKEQKLIDKFLKEKKIKDFVIIQAGFGGINKSKYPSRLWPPERYAKIADYIIKEYGFKIILTGSKEEEFIVNQIYNKIKNKKKALICTNFDISELASLTKKAKLVICPSTSIGHLSTALDTPVITLFGSPNFEEWRPWASKKKSICLFHPEVCTSCNKEECRKKTIECMGAITIQEVMDSINKLLD